MGSIAFRGRPPNQRGADSPQAGIDKETIPRQARSA
jgi:hypothetical protein